MKKRTKKHLLAALSVTMALSMVSVNTGFVYAQEPDKTEMQNGNTDIKEEAPEIEIPEGITGNAGQRLSEIGLPQGWFWADENTVIAKDASVYTARMSVDDISYDYSEVEGYDADGHYVEINLPVLVSEFDSESSGSPAEGEMMLMMTGPRAVYDVDVALYDGVDFSIADSKTYHITTNGTIKGIIRIKDGCSPTVYIDNVSIDNSSDTGNGIFIGHGASLDLYLIGYNVLKGGNRHPNNFTDSKNAYSGGAAGIYVPEDSCLNIYSAPGGSGTLSATGGNGNACFLGSGGGAGIGTNGSYGWFSDQTLPSSSGKISVYSGTIYAKGGQKSRDGGGYGAGIGGGGGRDKHNGGEFIGPGMLGELYIYGGTVNAYSGGQNADTAGSGSSYSATKADDNPNQLIVVQGGTLNAEGVNYWTSDFEISDIDYGQTPKPSVTAKYGTVEYAYSGGITPTNAGDYTVTASVPASSSYRSIQWTKPFKIMRLPNSWVTEPSIDDWAYGDTPKAPFSEAKYNADTVQYTYGISEDGPFSSDVPTEVGKWYMKACVPEANYDELSDVVEFEIKKASVSNSGTEDEVVYDGNTIDVSELFTRDANAGTPTYSLIPDEDGTGGKGTIEGTLLTVEKTGILKIKMITAGTQNYDSGEAVSTLTVKNGKIEYTVKDNGCVYDGKEHGITVEVQSPEGTGITYSTDGINFGETNPQFKDAGTYTVYFRIEKENYASVDSSCAITITPLDISNAEVKLGKPLVYNGKEQTQEIESVKVGDLDVTYKVTGNKVTNAGYYKMTITGTGNFTGEITVEYSVAVPSLKVSGSNGNGSVGTGDASHPVFFGMAALLALAGIIAAAVGKRRRV